MDCIAAGIPALIEKPLADDVVAAQALVEASERVGVPLLTGHHRRHNPMIQRAKAEIDSGRLRPMRNARPRASSGARRCRWPLFSCRSRSAACRSRRIRAGPAQSPGSGGKRRYLETPGEAGLREAVQQHDRGGRPRPPGRTGGCRLPGRLFDDWWSPISCRGVRGFRARSFVKPVAGFHGVLHDCFTAAAGTLG